MAPSKEDYKKQLKKVQEDLIKGIETLNQMTIIVETYENEIKFLKGIINGI